MDVVLQKKIDDLENIVNRFRHLVEKPKANYVKTRAPYYKHKYALQLKTLLDQMIVDGQDRVLLYKDYPNLTKTSLYNRINQSFQYVVNEMDAPDKTYSILKMTLIIKGERSGIRLAINLPQEESLIAHTNIPTEKKIDAVVAKIQSLITNFLEDINQNFFLCKDIALSHRQLKELEDFLNKRDSYTSKLLINAARKSIRIVKLI